MPDGREHEWPARGYPPAVSASDRGRTAGVRPISQILERHSESRGTPGARAAGPVLKYRLGRPLSADSGYCMVQNRRPAVEMLRPPRISMPCYAIEDLIPVVDPTAYVHPTAVLIGDVIVGPGCYVGPAASLRGDFGRIILHQGVNVQDTCVMHGFPEHDTVVETDGHVGHGAMIHGAHLACNVLIGMNAVVMDRSRIGESAIVGAMSFVREGSVIPPRVLALGIPARVVRPLTEAEMAWKQTGTREYQELAVRSLASQREVAPLRAVQADRPRFTGGPSVTFGDIKTPSN